MIIDKLIEAIDIKKNPTVVGLDPNLAKIPATIKEQAFAKYGESLKGAAEAFFQFNKGLIDSLHDIVPAVKPQIAMYEQYGAEGIETYIRTCTYAKENGLIVIGDVKRGDIASTATAYADGHLGRVTVKSAEFAPFDTDYITVNPYMGRDSVEPYLDAVKNYDKGLFILVKTSNPGSAHIQDLITDGAPLYEKVGRLVESWGAPFVGRYGYSALGAVVGATHPEEGAKLRKLLPMVFFLVPGYGAQGGKASDIARMVDANGRGVIVNSSRGIIFAYASDKYKADPSDYAHAARQAAIDMKEELTSALG